MGGGQVVLVMTSCAPVTRQEWICNKFHVLFVFLFAAIVPKEQYTPDAVDKGQVCVLQVCYRCVKCVLGCDTCVFRYVKRC